MWCFCVKPSYGLAIENKVNVMSFMCSLTVVQCVIRASIRSRQIFLFSWDSALIIVLSFFICHLWGIKRMCVFKHSVMTNFNCTCPAIQRGQGSGFLSEVPLDSLLVWASSGGSVETAWMRRLAWTFAAFIGDRYQICLTRPFII